MPRDIYRVIASSSWGHHGWKARHWQLWGSQTADTEWDKKEYLWDLTPWKHRVLSHETVMDNWPNTPVWRCILLTSLSLKSWQLVAWQRGGPCEWGDLPWWLSFIGKKITSLNPDFYFAFFQLLATHFKLSVSGSCYFQCDKNHLVLVWFLTGLFRIA